MKIKHKNERKWTTTSFLFHKYNILSIHNFMYKSLNESSVYDISSGNEDIIEKMGEVDIYDIKKKAYVKIKATDLLKVCSDGIYKMMRDYPYLYQFMAKCKPMYLPVWPSDITDTMCVDDRNNLWINLNFVYNDCKMDSNRVFGILFHEMFHVFFNHLLRFNEMYPKEMFADGLEGARKKANMKANICMDYEVNASMVEDGIVDAGFFKRMNLLYKKEYTGMTWEEIMNKVGDKEYKDWLDRNGYSLDDIELKILDAIEKASKVLMDPDAEDDEKRYARKELQKTLDDLLGKENRGDKTIQDELEELAESKLGDIGGLKMDIEDVVDDLYKSPAGMSEEELDKTLRDIDKMMDNISENAEDVASQFGKSSDDVASDAEKARESLKKAMEKMKEGGLSKEEKEDLIDKAKDDLEDIISDDVEKEKLKKKREERDAKKAAERKEKFKKTHPLRRMIVVFKNFIDLYSLDLISTETVEILGSCVDKLEPLTELHFKDMKKEDIDGVVETLNKLKDSFLPDLVALIDNETILNKTEDDMQRLLDGVFETVFKAFETILNPELNEDEKSSVVKMAAERLRIIGKILKTQKVWKVGDEFKDAYISEMKKLTEILKKEGPEAAMKYLIDKGVINPMYLDEKSLDISNKIMGKDVGGRTRITDIPTYEEPMSYTDIINGSDSDDEEKIEPYEGKLYYSVWMNEDSENILELSDISDGLEDHDFEQFGLKFEKDFPEYSVGELMESVFEVYYKGTYDFVDIDELNEKLDKHPDYEMGDWESEE